MRIQHCLCIQKWQGQLCCVFLFINCYVQSNSPGAWLENLTEKSHSCHFLSFIAKKISTYQSIGKHKLEQVPGNMPPTFVSFHLSRWPKSYDDWPNNTNLITQPHINRLFGRSCKGNIIHHVPRVCILHTVLFKSSVFVNCYYDTCILQSSCTFIAACNLIASVYGTYFHWGMNAMVPTSLGKKVLHQ